MPNPPSPTQLNTEDAVAMLAPGEVVQVIQRHGMPGKADVVHRWHRDFAADKIRHMGAHRSWDAPREGYGVKFTESNGDVFFVQTAAAS